MKKIITAVLLLVNFSTYSQWVQLTTNTTARFYTLFFTSPSVGFAGGAQETIIKTTDGGNTWNTVYQGTVYLKYITSIFFVDANNGFATGGDASGSSGYVLKTTDGGNNWNMVNSTLTFLPWKSYWTDISTGYFTVDDAISNGGGLYKSTNGGASWTNISQKDNATNVFFTSSTTGYFTAIGATIYKTINSGSTWTNTGSGINSIHFPNANIGYGVGSDAYKTSNAGQNWTLQSTIDSCGFGNGEVFFYDATNGIIVPQYTRIYFTHDGGNTWIMDTQLKLTNFFAAFMTAPNVAFAAGQGGQIWRNNNLLGGIESLTENSNINIFPNPFSTQTVLQTDNPFHNATLTVDNCFGQTVAQIKNLRGQTIVFNRDNLASGLYFVRLTEDNKTIAVTKLVIADR